MKISTIMTKKPHLIEETSSSYDAVALMRRTGCGILPIGNINQVVGVLTDRDIIMRAVALDKDLRTTKIKEIMTTSVVFCEEDQFLQSAVYQMNQHKIRRVLVKNANNQLSGILSLGDVIRRVQDRSLLADLLRETFVG